MEKNRHYRHQDKRRRMASTRFLRRVHESPADPPSEGKEGPLTTTSRDRITDRGHVPPHDLLDQAGRDPRRAAVGRVLSKPSPSSKLWSTACGQNEKRNCG